MNSKKILIPAAILLAAIAIIVIVNQTSNRNRGGEPELTLYPTDTIFSFDFAALHFVAPDKNVFDS